MCNPYTFTSWKYIYKPGVEAVTAVVCDAAGTGNNNPAGTCVAVSAVAPEDEIYEDWDFRCIEAACLTSIINIMWVIYMLI